MTLTNNTNFSLLDQNEIDALVKFLLEKKETLDSDVMNQKSIDKLIMLIKTDHNKLASYLDSSYTQFNNNILSELDFKDSDNDICTLQFHVDEETNFIVLDLINETTDKTLTLLPKHFYSNDSDAWGISMAPVLFTHLAYTLSATFTQETYDKVCDHFTLNQYGSLNYPIPTIYLPDNVLLMDCLK